MVKKTRRTSKNKYIAILCVMLLSCFAISGLVFAGPGDPNVEIATVDATPGNIVDVEISVDVPGGIAGYGLAIQYDPDVLTPSATAQTGTAGGVGVPVYSPAYSSDQVFITWAGTTALTSGGSLAILSFTVKSDAAAGLTSISFLSTELFDTSGEEILSPFNFNDGGINVLAPEIDVQGNSVSIANGDTTPSETDGTIFGSVDVTVGAVERTFTIENTGTATLNLTGALKAYYAGTTSTTPHFTFTSLPSTSIAAGGSTTFTIRFDPISTGEKDARIEIPNNDSDENPYTFIIAGSSVNLGHDASLSDLQVGGTTVDGFDPETTDYDVELPADTTIVPTVTYTLNDSDATAVLTNAAGLPGATTVEVTAEDGVTTSTYTINFTVAEPPASDDASLSDLQVNGTTVSGFAPGTTDYNVELPAGTIVVPTVTYTLNDSDATAVLTNAAGLPGATTVEVTAEDGVTTSTYTINFTVAEPPASDDASLSDLQVNGTTVSGFAPGTTDYNVELPAGTIVVPTVTYTLNDSDATAVLTNAAGLPGATTVEVTAEDGVTTSTYTIDFTVAAAPLNDDASLSDLQVGGTTVDGFDPDTTDYNVDLPAGTTIVPTVTYTLNDSAATAVLTDAAGLPGATTVEVTAEDGETTRTYTINFTVAAPPASDDASLSDLQVDGDTVNEFDPETTDYDVELPADTTIVPTVTCETTDPDATAIVTDAAALPGTATVEVTAEDGETTRTYTINFTLADGGTGTPDVSTLSAADVEETSATLRGQLTTDGDFDVTAYGFFWSDTAGVDETDSELSAGTGDLAQDEIFTESLTGLVADQTYYYVAYVNYDDGTTEDIMVLGDEREFTTGSESDLDDDGDLDVVTDRAKVTDKDEATVYAYVEVDEDDWDDDIYDIYKYGFFYGTDRSDVEDVEDLSDFGDFDSLDVEFEAADDEDYNDRSEEFRFSSDLRNLEDREDYYFRAFIEYEDTDDGLIYYSLGKVKHFDLGDYRKSSGGSSAARPVVIPEPLTPSVFTIGSPAYLLNGSYQVMDAAPYIKNSRTYLPIRYVAYAMGLTDADIQWDEAAQMVTLTKGTTIVSLVIGNPVMFENGTPVTMDVAPEITNDRTCLPIAWVARAFGYTAVWDSMLQTVTIR